MPAGAHAASVDGVVKGAGDLVRKAKVELFAAQTGKQGKLGEARTNRKGEFAISYVDAPGDTRPLYVTADKGKAHRRKLGREMRLMVVAGSVASPMESVVLSEQTTVASGYSLAQFLEDKRVSGPSPGMPNAAATSANLVEASTGKVSFVLANSPNGNATEALPTFNTLANALTPCTAGFRSACNKFLKAAKVPGKHAPRDTLEAVVDIARNPYLGVNVTQICGVRQKRCPKGTTTGDAISTPGTGYTSEALEHLTAVQVDSSGNVWVANNWSTGSPLSEFVGGNGLVEFVGAAEPVKTPLIGPPERP